MKFAKQPVHTLTRTVFSLLLIAALCMTLPGCAALDKTLEFFGYGGDSTPGISEGLVTDGMDLFNHGKYSSALKSFEEIKDRFPFSNVGLLAELKSADCNYFMENYREARTLYQEFEGNHPTNEAIPYVLFQIGMTYYQEINTVDRDPGAAMNAVEAFSRQTRSFPQSPYYQEAKARIMAARDFLAQHEFYVATFYYRTDEYKQAQGRLEYLVANYPDSSVTPQAGKMLADLKSGKTRDKSWKRFIPKLGLPDWKTFKSAFGILPGGGAASE
jgi:outer membrane protein assembly factor BamD